MNWGIEDFVAAAVLIISTVAALVVVIRGSKPWRAILAIGVVIIAVTIWAHLAVGIF